MKGHGDDSVTYFTNTNPPGSYNATLAVGSGTNKSGASTAQVITTNGNLHCDPATGFDMYNGYYTRPNNINNYAASIIYNYTTATQQRGDVDGEVYLYVRNSSVGGSAFVSLRLSNGGGEVYHFLNSSGRSSDGGTNCYTIRNDTGGGIRFMNAGSGFSAHGTTAPSGGATGTNAIANATSVTTGNIPSWSNQGYTVFCNSLTPDSHQPGLGIGSNNGDSNYIVSLFPSVQWMDLKIFAAATRVYFTGILSAYSVSGGWVSVSDAREKKDIKDVKTCRSLERVLACKPKTYTRKTYDKADGTPSNAGKVQCIGLLAQDMKDVNPHCISEWENKDIEKTDEDNGMRMGILYNDWIIHLIGSVQEQQSQITAQADKIKTLEERSIVLEERSMVFEEHARLLEKKHEDYVKLTDERFDKLVSLFQELKK